MSAVRRKERRRDAASGRHKGPRERVAPGNIDATPERIRHARAAGEAIIDGQGVRRLSDPLTTLWSRRVLNADQAQNDVMRDAGERLRLNFHGAGLTGVSAQDLTRDAVGGSRAAMGMPTSVYAISCREVVYAARQVIGERLWPYVTAIVVEERTVRALTPMVTDTGSQRLAEVIALERVREALHRLVDHWQLRADDRPRRMRASRAEHEPEPAI